MSKLLYFTEKEEERFFSKIDNSFNSEDCWIWLASKIRGYGMFKLKCKMVISHRLMYELAYGKILEGLHVLHTCYNPSCVNPNHLWLGTQQDNVNDMYSKGRQSRVGNRGRNKGMIGNRGGANGRSILTEEEVLEIRQLYSKGNFTQQEISDTFGISRPQVNSIVNRLTWKYV